MKDARETIALSIASTRAVDYDTVLPCDYDTADAILAAMPEIVGAMMKPLEWSYNGRRRHYSNNPYIFVKKFKRGFCFMLLGADGVFRAISMHSTLEAAKAAANDHHRAHVLGALNLK